MTGSASPDALDALRKSLAMAANDPGNVIGADGSKVGYKGDRCMGGWIADAILAGPLAPLLAAHQQVTAERDEARDLAYELKLAAAGGEDVPGSANLVTVEDVRRWRDEDARQLATANAELARLRAEGEEARAALAFYADEKNYRMRGPLDPNSSYFTGADTARTALARAATAREGQADA